MLHYNGQFQATPTPEFEALSRAFLLADGLFETLRVFDGRLPFLEKHLARMFAGMAALRLERPENWTADFFKSQILATAPPNARVRLTVWRSPGGKICPENNAPQFLISAEPLASSTFEFPETGIKLGICESVALPADQFSQFKLLGMTRHVAAAAYAREQGFDDALLPNQRGHVCEATASNVFFWKNGGLVTPSLSTGCVAGTMRATLLELAQKLGISAEEKAFTFAALCRADEVFLTNAVRGFVPVREFLGKKLPCDLTKNLFQSLTSFAGS